MSEKINKEIRDFFIKIGEDIKKSFDECCPCNCLNNRNRVNAKIVNDIENQITQDMNTENELNGTQVIIDIDEYEYELGEQVTVNRKKTVYYDCSEFNSNDETETETETKCDSPIIEDNFVIIY